MIEHHLLMTIVATIVLGIVALVIAERTKIPSIIFLLSLGVVFGPDLLNVVRPELLRQGLYALVALSIAIIMFEGGLTLQISNVRTVSKSVLNLITIGALVTWAGAAVVSWLILDISWTVAILFGSLVIVTGPTVIGPILRTVKVNSNIRTILKWEGILIDPVGAITAVLVLGFVTVEEQTLLATIGGFLGRIAIGTIIGLAAGFLMTRIMRLNLSESVSTLLIFAFVFLMFGVSDLIVKESGIMSVTIAGIVMGNMKVPNLHHVKGFKEKLTLLMVSSLFILLAANLRLQEIEAIGWKGVLVVFCLMLIVRPLNIWASIRKGSLDLKSKLFLSWIAPRGIIAAAVASLFSFTLAQHGFHEASLLSSLTFLTIAITVLVQGSTAKPLAKLLGVLQTGTSGVLVLGGNGLGVSFARELMEQGVRSGILDSNRRNLSVAQREGIATFLGDVHSDELWDEIDLTDYRFFIAATSNNELNSLACSKAKQFFDQEHIFQVRNVAKSDKHEYSLAMVQGNQRYDCPIDVLGVSTDLRAGSKFIRSIAPGQLSIIGGQSSILLAGLRKNDVIFSTDRGVLNSADNVLVLTDK
ncbi:MAG TPA: sodium:proton antiporter [Bacteroidota bacterium]